MQALIKHSKIYKNVAINVVKNDITKEKTDIIGKISKCLIKII